MSHPLTVELSDATYAALQLRAQAAAQSPAAAAPAWSSTSTPRTE